MMVVVMGNQTVFQLKEKKMKKRKKESEKEWQCQAISCCREQIKSSLTASFSSFFTSYFLLLSLLHIWFRAKIKKVRLTQFNYQSQPVSWLLKMEFIRVEESAALEKTGALAAATTITRHVVNLLVISESF